MNIVESFRLVRKWNARRGSDLYDKYADEWARVFCHHDWRDAVHAGTGSAWDTSDRFEFCVKCRTSRDKQS